MVKHKSNALAKLPKEQRSQFLIGPVSSWFMPNTTDIWTQVSNSENNQQGPNDDNDTDSPKVESMDCDKQISSCNQDGGLSYFVYGSIGCFCYGEIHHHQSDRSCDPNQYQPNRQASKTLTINHLIDVKEDNSRVACVRFLKGYRHPLVMVLTETGSFLVHDCLSSENLIHYKRHELIGRFVEPYCKKEDMNGDERNAKRTNVTQQINSCLWPNATTAFFGVSLIKEKTNLLIMLKLKDISEDLIKNPGAINKNDFILHHQKIELDLPPYASPICCMESAMLDKTTCLVAVAMDDGFICVVKVDLEEAKVKRSIKLVRHNEQVTALSFYTGNPKRYPMGLLASVSRRGLTLIWDVENEFYFADYQAIDSSNKGPEINWFTLCFVALNNQINLVISNPRSGLTVLELPENTRSKIRLKDNRDNRVQKQKGRPNGPSENSISHHAVLFNVICDPSTNTLVTTSLDGNHIVWSYDVVQAPANLKRDRKTADIVQVKPEYLYPCMSNGSKTHMLRFNPIREDLLGVALDEGRVKFFKISDSPLNHRFDMNPSCALIQRKINKASMVPTSLAWHPSHEYRVAIGTIAGKVLRVDLTPHKATLIETEYRPNVSKQPDKKAGDMVDDVFGVEYNPIDRTADTINSNENNKSNQFKTDGVYSLCWGPNPTCPQDVSRLAIYAIGSMSRRLFIYYNPRDNNDKMINYLDEFHDRSLPEADGEATVVAWKSSMDLMALGTTSGKIMIVTYLEESHADRSNNKLFKKLTVIQGPFETAHIQCLAWHPTTDKNDARYNYLAASASSNEPFAYVFNIKESLLVADVKSRLRLGYDPTIATNDLTNNIVSQYVHRLSAHKKPISDIVWNPHDPDQLATCSFDRCCYVWSIDRSIETELMESRILAKFSARDRLFTLEWSIVDSDLIFTSGNESSIWAWRPSENPLRANDIVSSS